MRLSVEQIRWGLAVAVVGMLLALAGVIGYGRYKAVIAYRQIIKKAGITLNRDSHGVTFSQSLGGKKTITVRAARETQIGKDKWALHDAELLLYTRSQEHPDRIYGSDFEYDQKEGLARALGEVEMDIEAPDTLRSRTEKGADVPKQAQLIHLKTSGLVYVRALGVAATEQPVEVHYLGLTCTARGAEFNTGQSAMHLLADVVMDGDLHGHHIHLTAARADLDRGSNVASFLQPVVTDGRRYASAASTTLDLRPDGSVERLLAAGGVALRDGSREVKAAEANVRLSEARVLQEAKLLGDVTLVDSDARRPMQGHAQTTDVSFDAMGKPGVVTAHGGNGLAARFILVDKIVPGKALERELQGETVVARFAHKGGAESGSALREMTVTGAGELRGESATAKTKLTADAMHATFAGGRDATPQHLTATGHTRLDQVRASGSAQTSTGDALAMDFGSGNSGAVAIASAVQTGHVAIESRAVAKAEETNGVVTNASAGRAEYDGATNRFTLTQSVRMTQAKTSLTTDRVVLDGETQDAAAAGHVQGTLEGTDPAKVTHLLATTATFTHATGLVEFRGNDAPAKMWQQASQVEAVALIFDDRQKTFAARPAAGGLVHAVLSAAHAKAANTVVRVSASRLDYNDATREAVFAGSVLMNGNGAQAQAQRAVALLTRPDGHAKTGATASPLNGSLDRVVLSGDVSVQQPGRAGTGRQLLYTSARETYVLTGTPEKPPRIEDSQQGSVTGSTLVFRDAGSTIVVGGETHGRVRTETEVTQ